jgi:hypothetical protein
MTLSASFFLGRKQKRLDPLQYLLAISGDSL